MGARQAEIDGLIAALRAQGICDERLLAAMGEIPRERFVPADSRARAYSDEPIAISHGQVTTQPSLIARMVEALGLTGSEKVLEVGGGFGYQTAVLAKLACEVASIELWPDMLETARASLAQQAITNVSLVVGDGTAGLADAAPFEAIIVAAAFESVPPPLVQQLAEGGRLVQPIGPGGHEDVVLFAKQNYVLVELKSVVSARFVRLYGRYGYRLPIERA